MKLFLTSTIALGTLCLIEMNQPAQATLTESVSPNFHLVRGGGHGGGGRGFAGHEDMGRAGMGRADEGFGRNDAARSNLDRSAVAADRQHTLDNYDNGHYDGRRNNDAWGAEEGWGADNWTGVEGGGCLSYDSQGNCIN